MGDFPLPVDEVVYEHQRWAPVLGWRHSIWSSDDAGKVKREREAVSCPYEYVWATEWEIDLRVGDKDGYEYAAGNDWLPDIRRTSTYRRRKWKRVRVHRLDPTVQLLGLKLQS